jgi:multiple sugar transport system permease protein
MVPREAMFVPLFLMFAEAELHNTYEALILPRIAAPLGVFIMTQFMAAIPHEIEEAARVDGATRWTIFWNDKIERFFRKYGWLSLNKRLGYT